MAAAVKRPGGELANRPLHFFWIADCSGSMYGDKIQKLNYAVRQTIPDMKTAANDNPNAQVLVRVLKFSTGAQWAQATPVSIYDFDSEWNDLTASGVTDMGKAFDLLADQLKIPPMSDRALPPILVLLSDGQPTDEYKKSLNDLKALPWGKKAVKVAISIGQDADDNVLCEFTGNKELVIQANNAPALVKAIKWASTLVKEVSSPASQREGSGSAPVVVNLDNIPSATDDPDVW